MRTTMLALLAALALLAGACADATVDPPGTDALGPAGACLAGDPDCEDVPGTTGPGAPPPASGAVPVADALALGIEGPFAIAGAYVADPSGARLCEALAESFPPQCGGASVPLDNTAGADLGQLSMEGDVVWSDGPVILEGELVDGVFVVRGES